VHPYRSPSRRCPVAMGVTVRRTCRRRPLFEMCNGAMPWLGKRCRGQNDALDFGCVKTLRGITAPGILASTVTRRAKKRKSLSSARHYDQIRFRFHTAKTLSGSVTFAVYREDDFTRGSGGVVFSGGVMVPAAGSALQDRSKDAYSYPAE
jgi:hypothetical protein